MGTCDFQLKTILHSYQLGERLVYHKKDGNFYTVSSTSSLDKDIYLISSEEVTEKIDEFIRESRVFNKEIIVEFTTCLDARIQKLNASTNGILALLYYLFNADTKAQLEKQKELLKNLRQTIDEISSEAEFIEQSPLDVDHEPASLQSFNNESPIKEQFNRANPTTPSIDRTVHSKTPSSFKKKPVQPQQPHTFVSTPQTSEVLRPLVSSPQPALSKPSLSTPNLSTPNLSTPSLSTPKNVETMLSPPTFDPTSFNSPPPPPPPPNFINSGQTSSQVLSKIQLPDEPSPLLFDQTNYKNLSQETVIEQVELIEEYIRNSKPVFESAEKFINTYLPLQKKLKNSEEELLEFSKQLKQCEENLAQLQEGAKKEEVTLLYFKTSQGYSEVPFYPSTLQEEILDKNRVIKNQQNQEKAALKEKLAKQKELLSKYNAQESHMSHAKKQQVQSKIKQTQELIQTLEDQLTDFYETPSLDESCFYSTLKISQAINLFQSLVEKLLKRVKGLEAKQIKIKQKEEKLSKACQKTYKMNVDTLQSTLQKKLKQLESWTRHKISRQQWLNHKKAGKESIALPKVKNTNQQPSICNDYAILQLLYQLPQNIRLLLKRESVNKGQTNVDEFGTTFYGQLYSSKD